MYVKVFNCLTRYGKDESQISREYEVLSKMECLSLAKRGKPLILFLDALDHMTNENYALGIFFFIIIEREYFTVCDSNEDMRWMPIKLPPFVRVVLSTLPDVGNCLEHLQQKYKNERAYLEISTLSAQVTCSNAFL